MMAANVKRAEKAAVKKRAKEATARKRAAKAAAKRRAKKAAAKKQAEMAAYNKRAEEYAAKKQAEMAAYNKLAEKFAAKKQAEMAAYVKRAEEYAAKKQAEEFAVKKRAEEYAAKKRAEEYVAKKQAEEYAVKKRAEEFAAKKKAEEFAYKKRAEEYAAKKQAEEFAAKKRAEEYAVKKQAEEFAAKKRAEEYAVKKQAEEAAAKKRAEETFVCPKSFQYDGEDEFTINLKHGYKIFIKHNNNFMIVNDGMETWISVNGNQIRGMLNYAIKRPGVRIYNDLMDKLHFYLSNVEHGIDYYAQFKKADEIVYLKTQKKPNYFETSRAHMTMKMVYQSGDVEVTQELRDYCKHLMKSCEIVIGYDDTVHYHFMNNILVSQNASGLTVVRFHNGGVIHVSPDGTLQLAFNKDRIESNNKDINVQAGRNTIYSVNATIGKVMKIVNINC